jgi:hypothetical protein
MSKFDDLRKQNPSWDVSLLDLIKQADPSDSNRYVAFLLKCIKKNILEPDKVISSLSGISNERLKQFHEWHLQDMIEKKDILQYPNNLEFDIQYNLAEEKAKMKAAESEVKKIHEDDEWLILLPQSYEAAALYGRKTKWCITQRTHWDSYKNKHFFIYIINKKNDKEKYCVSREFHSREFRYKVWIAADTETDIIQLPIPPELYACIFKELKENKWPVGFQTEDIKMWTTADGTTVKIDDMTISHLGNTIRKFQFSRSEPLLAARLEYMKEILAKKQASRIEREVFVQKKTVGDDKQAVILAAMMKKAHRPPCAKDIEADPVNEVYEDWFLEAFDADEDGGEEFF